MISHAAKSIKDTLTRDVLDETPIELKRQQWEAAARRQSSPKTVKIRYLESGRVPCLLCIPEHQKSTTTIVYFHGGGLVEGSVETHRGWTCRLAEHTGCKVLSVDYRLAPEAPYPAAVNDVMSVCNALSSNVDISDEICVGADSTGGVLALVALFTLNRRHGKKPKCAFLLSPSIDLTFSGDSFKTNASVDPLVSLDVLKHYTQLYAGSRDLRNPEISPLFANLHDIPPILIMADRQEILLDDATRLARRVEESGGISRLHVSQGLWHVWPLWGDFPESTIALNMISHHIANQGED